MSFLSLYIECSNLKRVRYNSIFSLFANKERNFYTKHTYKFPIVLANRSINTNQVIASKNSEQHHTSHSASKIKIVKKLNFISEKDATPFYNLSTKTLLLIYKTTKSDEENGFCSNRLYYISQKINYPPSIISKRIVKRIFIYQLKFDWLERSLNTLLEYNVSGERISRDLWVLKYHHSTIRERLERIKSFGIETFYPWMVRCSEEILIRYIEISQETKSILGENKSTKMYLANRFKTTPEVIEDMYIKVPALKTIRVSKAKKLLDFLINEGFIIEEIADKARIFGASQETIKDRLQKLRTLGLSEINLNVLCRSRKDFQKYYESIESIVKEK